MRPSILQEIGDQIKADAWPGEECLLRWSKDLSDLHFAVFWRWRGQLREVIVEDREVGPVPLSSLDDVVREHIRRVRRACGGNVDSPTGAAVVLKVNPSTLRSRMKKLGIR